MMSIAASAHNFDSDSHTQFKGIGQQSLLGDVFKFSLAVIQFVKNLTLLICERLSKIIMMVRNISWKFFNLFSTALTVFARAYVIVKQFI